MARQTKLGARDRINLRWIVNHLHVSTPDAEVLENIQKRCDKIQDTVTPGWVKQAKEYALKAHHSNQNFVKKHHF